MAKVSAPDPRSPTLCPRCGNLTVVGEADGSRICLACGFDPDTEAPMKVVSGQAFRRHGTGR